MEGCNPVSTPGAGLEISINQPKVKLLNGPRIQECQVLVGALQYLAQVTRYDIRYVVSHLSNAFHKLLILHMGAAKKVLRYLKKGCPDTAIVYKKG